MGHRTYLGSDELFIGMFSFGETLYTILARPLRLLPLSLPRP